MEIYIEISQSHGSQGVWGCTVAWYLIFNEYLEVKKTWWLLLVTSHHPRSSEDRLQFFPIGQVSFALEI